MSAIRKASYAIFGALVLAAVYFDLDGPILGGLCSYMVLELTARAWPARWPSGAARWISVVVFAAAVGGVGWAIYLFLRQAFSVLPEIVAGLEPKLRAFVGQFGVDLPFQELDELRQAAANDLQRTARHFLDVTMIISRGFFEFALSIVIAVLCFMRGAAPRYLDNLNDALRQELYVRVRIFMESFEKVFGAQVLIAGINACLTGIFIVSVGIPHASFLVPATFLLGMAPVIGNLISNTIIVAAALGISVGRGLAALIFLVVIHKLEYILNSRIMGKKLDAPMWQTLLAILLGETMMGIPGILLAPTVLHYLKTEMQLVPFKYDS